MNYEKRKEEERREQLALPAPEEENVEMERGAEMRDEVMEEEQIEGGQKSYRFLDKSL